MIDDKKQELNGESSPKKAKQDRIYSDFVHGYASPVKSLEKSELALSGKVSPIDANNSDLQCDLKGKMKTEPNQKARNTTLAARQSSKSPSIKKENYLVTNKEPIPDFRASLVKKSEVPEENPLEVMYEIFQSEMNDFYSDGKNKPKSTKKSVFDYLKANQQVESSSEEEEVPLMLKSNPVSEMLEKQKTAPRIQIMDSTAKDAGLAQRKAFSMRFLQKFRDYDAIGKIIEANQGKSIYQRAFQDVIDKKPLPDWLRSKIKDWNGHYKQIELPRDRSQSSLEEASSGEGSTPVGRSTSNSKRKESGTGRAKKKSQVVSFMGVAAVKAVAKRRDSKRRTSTLSHLKDEPSKVA